MSDEPSLSDHEQRILAEIERNLAAEDPDFVRNVSEVRPSRDSGRTLRLSILGLLVGLALLLGGLLNSVGLGIAGYLVMLASVVGIVSSVRNISGSGRPSGGAFRDAWRKAEERMRSRRRDR